MECKYSKNHLSTTTRVVAAWLAGCILLLSLAATSPALHEALHNEPCCKSQHASSEPNDDASGTDSEHLCAVTLLQSGLILSLALELPVVGIIGQSSSVDSYTLRLTQTKLWTYSSRAPPAERVV